MHSTFSRTTDLQYEPRLVYYFRHIYKAYSGFYDDAPYY